MSEPFELWPGFKVPPTDPSRDVKRKPLTVAPEPEPYDPSNDYDDDEEPCKYCDGWGYKNCFCGGDLCVCHYYGEIPCFHCG